MKCMQLSHLLLLLTLQHHHIPLPLPPPAGDSSCLLSGGQLQYARCCTFLLYFLRLRPRLPSGWKIITLEMGPQIQKNKSGIFLLKSIWFTLIHKWITPEFYTNFRRKTFQSRYYSSPTTWILFLSSATSQGHNRYILIGKKYIYILAINQIVSMCQNIFEKFMPEIRLFFLKVPMVVGGVMFSSVTQSRRTLCDPMNRSTPGLPVHHQLPEGTQTHVHWVGDAIHPSHPLSSPSPPAPNPSQHQGLFQWVSSSHQVVKYWSFNLSWNSVLPMNTQDWSPLGGGIMILCLFYDTEITFY